MKEEIRSKLWRICKNTPVRSPLVIVPGNEPKFLDLNKYFSSTFSNYFLELGSGWGEVALELAQKQPNTGFLAMERKWNRLAQTDEKAKELDLKNLIFSGINFQWFIDDIFEPKQFHTVLLNFPDPWPKKKHHKNRAINPTFLKSIYRVLKPGGRFLFATDHGGYFRWSIRELRKSSLFRYEDQEWSNERPGFPISEFETEKRKEGKNIYYLERIKV
jgi:tRNA (guanine-N7-)-methyltransferase